MSKELLFVQCELKRRHEDLDAYIIIWIPEKYAIKDKILKIKNENKEWVDGWKVIHVYNEIKKTEKEANIDAEAWKHQRECSDI